MAKKKALGQDPLAWIKLTQEMEDKRKEQAAPPPVEEGEAAPAQTAGTNWPFLCIYIVNMAILLVLVFLIYRDVSARQQQIATEVTRIQEQVRAIEDASPRVTPTPAPTPPAPGTPANP